MYDILYVLDICLFSCVNYAFVIRIATYKRIQYNKRRKSVIVTGSSLWNEEISLLPMQVFT